MSGLLTSSTLVINQYVIRKPAMSPSWWVSYTMNLPVWSQAIHKKKQIIKDENLSYCHLIYRMCQTFVVVEKQIAINIYCN